MINTQILLVDFKELLLILHFSNFDYKRLFAKIFFPKESPEATDTFW